MKNLLKPLILIGFLLDLALTGGKWLSRKWRSFLQ